MNLKDFWIEYQSEILLTSLFAIFCIGLLIYLSIVQTKEDKGLKSILITLSIILTIVFGLTYTMIKREVKYINIVIIDTLIITAYSIVSYIMIKDRNRQYVDASKKTNTKKVASLGVIVGLSSVLMFFDIPIFPIAPFLKVELSGLMIFMTLVWFDYRSAIIVSLLTNLIHVIMPTSPPPLIPFLDEGVNFVATMVFLTPAAIVIANLKESSLPNKKQIIITTVIGVLLTTTFMTLYNYFINLPIVYNMDWAFKDVVKVFTTFNIIKWGIVAIVINLTWVRLYSLKETVMI